MAAIPLYDPGFRLVTGDSLNNIVNTVNNITGGGTPIPGTFTDLTVTGNTLLGNAVGDTIGFYGVAGVVQPSGTAQSAVGTTAITGPVTTTATSTTPWGYATSTQANVIVSAVNSLISQGAALVTLCNAMQAALVSIGAIKGSA